MHDRAVPARGPAQAGERPTPGPTPPPRAATLRPQDRDRRRHRADRRPRTRPRPPRRPRGQQPGQPGPQPPRPLPPARRRRGPRTARGQQCCCRRCGQPFAAFPGTEDTTILEVEVRAHRRVIRRRRYRPTCACGAHPGIVTAPPPPRLIPKSILGVSIWVDGPAGQVPVLPPDLPAAGRLAHARPGPVAGHPDRRPAAAGAAVRAGLRGPGRAQPGSRRSGTPTRPAGWSSPRVEGKVGYRWYLWVFHAAEVVVFVLAAGRPHDVPEEHFGPGRGRAFWWWTATRRTRR